MFAVLLPTWSVGQDVRNPAFFGMRKTVSSVLSTKINYYLHNNYSSIDIFNSSGVSYHYVSGLAQNTAFMYSGTNNNGTNLLYPNGSLTSNSTGASFGSGTNLPIIVGGNNEDFENWQGYIYEVVFFNSVLTTEQRQRVEGYLALKWGLTTLPSGHPYKSFSPFPAISVNFVPALIPGCQLWFDATDPLGTGRAPNSGTTITSWKDKSGNANNATGQVSAVVTSDSTGSYLNFTGSNSYTIGSGAFIANQYYTIFIVETLQSPSFQHLIGNGTLGPDNAALHIRYDSPTILRFASFNNDLDANNIPAFTTAAAQPTRILTFSQLPNSRTIYINSTSFGSNTNNTLLSAWAQPLIGQSFGQGYYTGKMREIIFYTGQLTTTQRQQVESYLAWKWGLQASLPSDHTYKFAPPSV
jgi:hypothetical protein